RVALVDELPYQTIQAEGDAWVEIASSGSEDEASLLQGFLEAEGVPARIENVKFHMGPTNFGAMGEIRIYVSSEDEPRALELLRKREEEYEQLDDDDETLVTDEGPADVDENAQPERDDGPTN
ncbi:MAG TPA: DUF2007 domain-containing protein, partial [Thermoanaerobaculia bacterium]|nr:DUF2007 domain-containing protein [Thermoanaerobaculia bacterium]